MPDVIDVTNVGSPGDAGDKKGSQKPAKTPGQVPKRPAGRKAKIDYAAERRKQVILTVLLVVVAVAAIAYTGYWLVTRQQGSADFTKHPQAGAAPAPSRAAQPRSGSVLPGSGATDTGEGTAPASPAGIHP